VSTARVRDAASDWSVSWRNVAAGGCVAVVVATYLSVLYDVVTVVDDPTLFVGVVVGAVVLAGVLRALPWTYAVGLASAILVGGLALYLSAVPPAYFDALSPLRVLQDTVALLTGYSVLRMPAAGAWATAVAPAPTFLAAYLAFRGQHTRAAGVAAATLGFFVLTGDSTTTTTLVGVLAAAGAVGFGTLAAHAASARQTQVLTVVLAVMIVGSATVTAVPGGQSPLVPASSSNPSAGSLVSADGYVGVGGSLDLDPRVQFVVESERASYYRAGVYDRYTGDGWVRTADVGSATTPSPTGERVRQRITAERTLDVLPSAPVPQSVSGIDAEVADGGLLVSGPSLRSGDTYVVDSRRPVNDSVDLSRETGTVPDRVAATYLQLPDSTDDRVVDLAASLTEDAESNYERAAAVERWLEANKQYSLDAPKPDGDLVTEFVLGDAPGYCTYFASAMTVMLRSQGVPARFVTGFTPGEQVAEDEWVVRGLDSHAWVEVYVPDRGWVRFDPTPSGERTTVEQQRITEARASGTEGVDAAGSEDGTWTPTNETTTTTPTTETTSAGVGESNAPTEQAAYGVGNLEGEGSDPANVTPPTGPNGATGSSGGPTLPTASTLLVWGVLVGGAVAGARYSGLTGRAYRAVWLRWLPRGDPREEVEGAFERVEYVLERQHREREPGETVREFVADVRADDRARRVAALRERARYAGRVDRADAAEARRLARSLAAENSRLPDPRR
jgi:transglutaminase-like putative cysteine protease